MNNNYMVPTGSIISEYLEEINLNYKQIADRMEISESTLLNILNGKIEITENIAQKLELVIKDVPYTYWLNYEFKYREFKSQENIKQFDEKTLKVISKRFKFKSVFKGLDWSLEKQANEMLKLLKLENFSDFDKSYMNFNVDFMEDGGEKESIAIWLNLAEEEIEIQNDDSLFNEFDSSTFENDLKKFKILSLNTDYEKGLISARKLLNRHSVYLVIHEAVENSKVRGALTTYENNPAIYLSGRFKTHDHIWFALMHEIGHLLMHYIPNETIVSFEDDYEIHDDIDKKEEEANEFARNFFINSEEYKDFIDNKKISEKNINEFSAKQKILPGILVARLQHDGYLSYDKFNYLKDKKKI